MTWHQTIVVGNLGSDPELRYLQSGQAVCNFSVAVSERWRDRNSGEQRERTTWYRVAAWGQLAETCNTYLSKGRQVMVTGNVSARGYLNNNGEAAASLDLTAREVRFLGNRGDQGGDYGGGQQRGGSQGGQQRGGYQREQGNQGGYQRGGYQREQGNQGGRGGYQQDDRASNYPDSRPQTSDDIPF
ncbi:MAG: single-stranded DNA-binding protein [Chloroflexi bacterium]|nr:single-stranded DNA-binding protein [Chloroflexota bacterium]MCY3581293.1 single-stranded DNA-binding protein [Chloroflexota bacterium]MCY3716717.1 single-stranded DNA-binding protein [Chloroflexota bacterium]MDE2649335.1 single-stranded DNA-binding protein [Chloroflexota bacterium]MXV92343.1 single-stranded DNA-binding protein [Chloroflexota bacterium]